jgi:RNA polymerase sigma factor (sigma-70 family)
VTLGKRKGFKHWLGTQDLPIRLAPGILLRYYQILRYGVSERNKKAAGHKIIRSHIRLGLSRTARYVKDPTLVDDMVSAMLYGLTRGVQRMAEGAIDKHTEPNISGFLALTMDGYIRKAMIRKVDARPLKEKERFVSKDEVNDLREILDSCLQTDEERVIFQYLESGLSFREIAPELKCSHEYVRRIKNRVAQRVKEKLAC